jgi:hypothetical protein
MSCHEDVLWVEVNLHAFLTSALDGDVWLASRLGRFTLHTHCIGSWVGARADLAVVVKRERASLNDEINDSSKQSAFLLKLSPPPFHRSGCDGCEL